MQLSYLASQFDWRANYVATVAPDGSYGCQTVQRAITFGHSSLVLAAVLAAALALTVVVFRHRDVA